MVLNGSGYFCLVLGCQLRCFFVFLVGSGVLKTVVGGSTYSWWFLECQSRWYWMVLGIPGRFWGVIEGFFDVSGWF